MRSVRYVMPWLVKVMASTVKGMVSGGAGPLGPRELPGKGVPGSSGGARPCCAAGERKVPFWQPPGRVAPAPCGEPRGSAPESGEAGTTRLKLLRRAAGTPAKHSACPALRWGHTTPVRKPATQTHPSRYREGATLDTWWARIRSTSACRFLVSAFSLQPSAFSLFPNFSFPLSQFPLFHLFTRSSLRHHLAANSPQLAPDQRSPVLPPRPQMHCPQQIHTQPPPRPALNCSCNAHG